MFRCDRCNRQTRAHEKAERLVVETAERTYASRGFAHPRPGHEYYDDPGGQGSEIVREQTVCAACAVLVRNQYEQASTDALELANEAAERLRVVPRTMRVPAKSLSTAGLSPADYLRAPVAITSNSKH